jgi:hypothetical protein
MQNRNQLLLGFIVVAMLSTTIISVSASQSFAQNQVNLNGGASFPFPLIDTWRVAYFIAE